MNDCEASIQAESDPRQIQRTSDLSIFRYDIFSNYTGLTRWASSTASVALQHPFHAALSESL